MLSYLLLAAIYMAFVSLGLPDSVFGVAWPQMRSQLASPLEAAGLVAILLTCCSALSSVSSAKVTTRFGPGPVVLFSSILTALGLFGYSLAPNFAWVLVAALPLGFGQGAVDTALNSYVASHYSSRHMSWLHASWGLGATIGPAVMTWAIAGAGNWRLGYRSLAAVQACLALVFFLSLGLWSRIAARPLAGDGQGPQEGNGDGAASGRGQAARRIGGLGRPEPWIQVLMYALYAACEASVGIWAASLFIEARGMGKALAGLMASVYYGGIMGGRVLSGLVADRLGNRRMVRLGLGVAMAGAALLILGRSDALALPAMALLGLGFAPIFPCLMHETPKRFDEATYRSVIGYQLGSAYLGTSIFPGAVGLLAARLGLEVLGPCVLGFLLMLLGLNAILDKASPN